MHAGFAVFCTFWIVGALFAQSPEELGKAYQRHELLNPESAPASANREYRLMLPKNYAPENKAGEKRWPLLIYMHGAGSKGSDGVKPLREDLPKLMATPEMRERFECFVLVPQCRDGDDVSGDRPNNWVKWNNQREKPVNWTRSDEEPSDQLLGAMAALEDVLKRYPVDDARIYLTGVSMGGSASWNWSSRDPQRFAAMIPVCGLSDARRAPPIKEVLVWTFHGGEDEQVPVQRTRDMVKALRDAGSHKVRYTEYEGEGHSIAKRVWREDDYASLRWLFEQRRIDR